MFHYSNEGICSWYDFAKQIFEVKNLDSNVKPIGSTQYPTSAKRPFYSVLNKSLFKATYGIEISYWRDPLVSCLRKIELLKKST